MHKSVSFALIAIWSLAAASVIESRSETPGVSARDCVQVRYIEDVWMNHQGTRVAYLVKSPNLVLNRNDYQLYVYDLAKGGSGSAKLVIAAPGISDVGWLGDGRRLSMLMPVHSVKAIVVVDTDTDKQETLTAPEPIFAYSMDDAGDAVAYGVEEAALGKRSAAMHSDDQIASGYRVPFGESEDTSVIPTYSLNTRRRMADGQWGEPTNITIQDPFNHRFISHIPVLQYMSLSPDGERLLLNYWTEKKDLPAIWMKSPWVREAIQDNIVSRIMVLYEFKSQTTTLAFNTVFPDSKPLWYGDSKSFLVNAHSPVGSVWEQEDIHDHRISGPDANMFWVDPKAGKVEEVYRQVPAHHENALFWRDDGDVLIHEPNEEVVRVHRNGQTWSQTDRIRLPHGSSDRFSSLQSNGTAVVGIHETVSEPQNLFLYESGKNAIRILTDLNPQLGTVKFAPVQTVHWTAVSGVDVEGLLFMPQDYVPGKRYPLVIQTKGDQGWFTCDSGQNHDPSFAPQPIANAGMMYLARTVEPGFNYQNAEANKPAGYPGRIDEAAQQMDIWESAVRTLTDRGLVDPSKVGILGFSRTGWYVEFMLAQSSIRFAAATAADNAQYSLSEYWLIPDGEQDAENIYGGPPYGKSLGSWMQYSISFNLEKVHTPLLMEQMGYGVHDDTAGSRPDNLTLNYEILTGLKRLGKPFEMYYYPDEDHQPDHPKARLASLQRNVDWYRFWLLGYEDPAPDKRDQFLRWRHLRELHDADSASAADEVGKNSASSH